jgi:hypothetical protein
MHAPNYTNSPLTLKQALLEKPHAPILLPTQATHYVCVSLMLCIIYFSLRCSSPLYESTTTPSYHPYILLNTIHYDPSHAYTPTLTVLIKTLLNSHYQTNIKSIAPPPKSHHFLFSCPHLLPHSIPTHTRYLPDTPFFSPATHSQQLPTPHVNNTHTTLLSHLTDDTSTP